MSYLRLLRKCLIFLLFVSGYILQYFATILLLLNIFQVFNSFSDGILFYFYGCLLISYLVMSVDDNGNSMLGGLFKGAKLYLVKPITMDDLKNLWQFALIEERENVVAEEEVSGIEEESSLENASGVDVKSQPLTGEGRQNLPREKRKRSNGLEEENGNSTPIKKSKLIWTKELHNRFLQAIEVLGIDGAHPKEILQHMNVPGLRKENVSSHLQKYRLSLKREQDAIHKTMNIGSTVEHLASHHLLSPLSPRGGVLQFSNLQSVTVADQPEINGLIQENLNGHIPVHSPGSSYLLKHVDSNHNDASSTIKFEQQTLWGEQLDSATYPECYQIGDRVANNEGLIDFHQIENLEQFLDGETDLLNIGDSELENLLRCPTLSDDSLQEEQKQQQSVLPEPLQAPSPPPREQEEHDALGPERGREFDDLFILGKGTSQPFNDENFDDFW
ncbi:hypothetical protein PTKIN_Ptkin15bG0032700 [Pterospermum kingtungense]